jgi:hypothetical protein
VASAVQVVDSAVATGDYFVSSLYYTCLALLKSVAVAAVAVAAVAVAQQSEHAMASLASSSILHSVQCSMHLQRHTVTHIDQVASQDAVCGMTCTQQQQKAGQKRMKYSNQLLHE